MYGRFRMPTKYAVGIPLIGAIVGIGIVLGLLGQHKVQTGSEARTSVDRPLGTRPVGSLSLPPDETTSPQTVFKRVAPSVFVIEALDVNGNATKLGSGMTLAAFPFTPADSGFDAELARTIGRVFAEIVTNAHVVRGSRAIRIRQGNAAWRAKVGRIDEDNDLCLLVAEGVTAPAVAIRSVTNLTVGERVYAIGSPLGLELTFSEGIISAIRGDESKRIIQTTAPMSHGSSGGGLFDVKGNLVGIATFGLSEAQNLNFAVPADLAKKLLLLPGEEDALQRTGLPGNECALAFCTVEEMERITETRLGDRATTLAEFDAAGKGNGGKKPQPPEQEPRTDQPHPVKPASADEISRTPASGRIRLYPLELGKSFSFTLGDKDYSCSTESHNELECKYPNPTLFHAALVVQGDHEFLVGCKGPQSDSCMDIPPGTYSVVVHGTTLVFTDSRMADRSTITGDLLRTLTPVFSVLKKLK